MPNIGEYQQPAGREYGKTCGCKIPETKKMNKMGACCSLPGFTIESPEYKGNPALRAQRVKSW